MCAARIDARRTDATQPAISRATFFGSGLFDAPLSAPSTSSAVAPDSAADVGEGEAKGSVFLPAALAPPNASRRSTRN